MIAYPLQWPQGWKRTPAGDRKRAQFGKSEWRLGAYATADSSGYRVKAELSVSDSVDRVLSELERLAIEPGEVVFSTNLQTRLNGLPRSGQAEPADPGAAVYWRTRKGELKVMAVDRYDRVADNLAAIAATLEAMRAIERHGGAAILDRAFTGFDALPAPMNWRQVLGLSHCQTIDEAEARYRELARRHHPDVGGSAARMAELNQARDAARREFGQ